MQDLEQIIEEAVRRIVDEVQPLRVVLFGSAARGEMGPNSDLDLLVVVPNGNDRIASAQKLYRRLRGIRIAKDIVVVLQEDVEKYGTNPYLIIYTALTEGKELYRAA